MPEPLDITNLRGNDLWSALTSKQPVKVQKPEKKLSPRPSLRWQDESLVFIIHQVTCLGCEHTYEYPNSDVFLRRIGKNASVHYARLESNIQDPEARFMELKIHRETRQTEVRACQFCCDLAHIIERARKDEKNESLPNETLPAEPKSTIDDSIEPVPSSTIGDLLAGIPSNPVLGD